MATNSSRLFIFDRKTGQKFLIDSGSEVSVVPPVQGRKKSPVADFTLFAANNTKIPAYGVANRQLDLGLRKPFMWTFVIADVTSPIIGADFLRHFNLLVDLKRKRLVNPETSLHASGTIVNATQHSIVTISKSSGFEEILLEYPGITNPTMIGKSASHGTVHHILTRGQPVASKPRRLHPKLHDAVKAEFEYLLEQGIIRPSKSPWSSPLHVVPKQDSSVRPVGDYRRLNAVTEFDSYPIPYLQDFAGALYGKRIFSKVDIFKAYHFIPIAEEDIEKTAVTTPWGLYEYTRLCFGLVNAAQTFMRFMHEVVRGLKFCYVYLDDILCFSDDEEQHKVHLHQLFKRLQQYGLSINLSKSVFGATELDFLGHTISAEGVKPLPSKVKAIADYEKPKTVAELRRFLGLMNFYRRFLPRAADKQILLHDFLKGSIKKNDKREIPWFPEATQAFEDCKNALSTVTLLAHPSPVAELTLHVDASDFAIGGALHQLTEKGLQPLGFYSRRLNPAEVKYSAYDRELLAAYASIKYFQHMLEAREFTLVTDHKPLIYAFREKNNKCTPRQIRQLDYISQFTTKIRHISGSENVAADVMSRISMINMPGKIDYKAISAAQKVDSELAELLSGSTSLNLRKITLPEAEDEIVCDFSTGVARPYIPKVYRQEVFEMIHNLAHPGMRRTKNMVKKRFIWPSVCKDITSWTRQCMACQKSKIHRHTKAPLAEFKEVSQRFEHIHLDIIGPLPPSNGFSYCLTMIDRFSRWPEAQPVKDITAETIAEAFFSNWISRYGSPSVITTDQGRQFEAELFHALTKLIGAKRSRSAGYHPQSNGLIEELHKPLKTALKCYETEKWTEILPTILLGMRSALKEDIGCTSAELVFGSTLRLPGEFLDPTKTYRDEGDFVSRLRSHMQSLRPQPTHSHGKRVTFVHKDLHKVSHVFLRRDMVRRPLQQPYDGPFKVLTRGDKVFKIDVNGKQMSVSIDRLKPAYTIETSEELGMALKPNKEEKSKEEKLTPAKKKDIPLKELTSAKKKDIPPIHKPEKETIKVTRSGRQVHFPKRFR